MNSIFGLFRSIIVIIIFDNKIFPSLANYNHFELVPSKATVEIWDNFLAFSYDKMV